MPATCSNLLALFGRDGAIDPDWYDEIVIGATVLRDGGGRGVRRRPSASPTSRRGPAEGGCGRRAA